MMRTIAAAGTFVCLCLSALSQDMVAEPSVGGRPAKSLGFIENRGQFDAPPRFVVRTRGLVTYLLDTSFMYHAIAPAPRVTKSSLLGLDPADRGPAITSLPIGMSF